MLSLFKKFIDLFNPHSILHTAVDMGSHDKPTIVLLHGIAATSKSYDALIDQIDATKYRVIALDLLGFGKSPKPKSHIYDVYDHVSSVKNTIDRLHIRKPFILVGHSMGSIIAANYARNYTSDIERLFLLSLPLYVKGDEMPQSILSRKQTDLFLSAYQFLSNKKNMAIKYSKRLRKLLRLNDGMDINEENWNAFRRSLRSTIINQDAINDIKMIKAPINIIYGALDSLIVQENVGKLNDLKNVSITKIPGVHHLIDRKFAAEIAKQIIG